MHPSAMQNCKQFYQSYIDPIKNNELNIVEIGSQNVNGSLRELFTDYKNYLGVDFIPGKGVDHVLKDPYIIDLESNSVDIVLSSSCYEHSDMFWLLHLEIIRILKPQGLFYLNAPSSGFTHRYPIDSWRFFPDAALSMAVWANRNGYNTKVLESFIDNSGCGWRNFVGVTIKDANLSVLYPNRIAHITTVSEMSDGHVF